MVSARAAGKAASTVRNRKGAGKAKAEVVPQVENDTRDAARKKLEEDVPGAPIVWTFKLRCRYWSGFLLGAVACAGTYLTYDRADEWKGTCVDPCGSHLKDARVSECPSRRVSE